MTLVILICNSTYVDYCSSGIFSILAIQMRADTLYTQLKIAKNNFSET